MSDWSPAAAGPTSRPRRRGSSSAGPWCQRPLARDWLFADAGLDRVDATLNCCTHDALYFLGRDGFDRGPCFPDHQPPQEKR